MGRKSAHTGMSPKDRSFNLMDRFMKKNSSNEGKFQILPARRKGPDVPFELWPYEDQIAYYDNMTDADRFDEKFKTYSDWFTAVRTKSNVYHVTFNSYVADKKTLMQKMFADKIWPNEAVRELQKLGVY